MTPRWEPIRHRATPMGVPADHFARGHHFFNPELAKAASIAAAVQMVMNLSPSSNPLRRLAEVLGLGEQLPANVVQRRWGTVVNVNQDAPTAPSAPTIAAAVATGAGTAGISYYPPSDNGGAPIDSYQANTYDHTGALRAQTQDPTGSPTIVAGLLTTEAYTFTVQAHNGYGWSPESSPSSAITLGAGSGKPTPPTNLLAVAGDTQVKVTLSAPQLDGGSPVDKYEVDCDNGTVMTQANGPFTFTGLSNGTGYSFKARAHNANGWSAFTQSFGPVTPSGTATLPGVPTGLAANQIGTTGLELDFVAGATGGGVMQAVEVMISEEGQDPVITGILDNGGVIPSAYAAAVTNVVVQCYWADLQSTSGGPLQWTIAQTVAEDVNGNKQYTGRSVHDDIETARTNGYLVKLRIFCGIWAPDWVKNLSGGPVTISDPSVPGSSYTCGLWWRNAYRDAYTALLAGVALQYDTDPVVVDLQVSRCTTIYAEPFTRQGTTNNAALINAGFTPAADLLSIAQSLDQAAAAFTYTRFSMPLNPYQYILDATHTTNGDWADTQTIAQATLDKYGTQFVPGNNSFRDPMLTANNYDTMYTWLQNHKPFFAQVAQNPSIGDLSKTMQTITQMGASSAEMHSNEYEVIPPGASVATLTSYASLFPAAGSIATTQILDTSVAYANPVTLSDLTQLASGHTYQIAIRVSNEAGWSDWTPTVDYQPVVTGIVPPGAPTGVTATQVADVGGVHTVDVAYTDPVISASSSPWTRSLQRYLIGQYGGVLMTGAAATGMPISASYLAKYCDVISCGAPDPDGQNTILLTNVQVASNGVTVTWGYVGATAPSSADNIWYLVHRSLAPAYPRLSAVTATGCTLLDAVAPGNYGNAAISGDAVYCGPLMADGATPDHALRLFSTLNPSIKMIPYTNGCLFQSGTTMGWPWFPRSADGTTLGDFPEEAYLHVVAHSDPTYGPATRITTVNRNGNRVMNIQHPAWQNAKIAEAQSIMRADTDGSTLSFFDGIFSDQMETNYNVDAAGGGNLFLSGGHSGITLTSTLNHFTDPNAAQWMVGATVTDVTGGTIPALTTVLSVVGTTVNLSSSITAPGQVGATVSFQLAAAGTPIDPNRNLVSGAYTGNVAYTLDNFITDAVALKAVIFNAIQPAAAGANTAVIAAGGYMVPATTLSANIGANDMTIPVVANGNAGFPSLAAAGGPFSVQIDNEWIVIASGGNTTSWTVSQRGAFGTQPAIHSGGANVTTAPQSYGLTTPSIHMGNALSGRSQWTRATAPTTEYYTAGPFNQGLWLAEGFALPGATAYDNNTAARSNVLMIADATATQPIPVQSRTQTSAGAAPSITWPSQAPYPFSLMIAVVQTDGTSSGPPSEWSGLTSKETLGPYAFGSGSRKTYIYLAQNGQVAVANTCTFSLTGNTSADIHIYEVQEAGLHELVATATASGVTTVGPVTLTGFGEANDLVLWVAATSVATTGEVPSGGELASPLMSQSTTRLNTYLANHLSTDNLGAGLAWTTSADVGAEAVAMHVAPTAYKQGQIAVVYKYNSTGTIHAAQEMNHLQWAMAEVLLGQDSYGSSLLSFTSGPIGDRSQWAQIASLRMGEPLAPYSQVSGVLQRNYQGGVVIANTNGTFGTGSNSVTVPSAHYVDVAGTAWDGTSGTIAVPSQTALVLTAIPAITDHKVYITDLTTGSLVAEILASSVGSGAANPIVISSATLATTHSISVTVSAINAAGEGELSAPSARITISQPSSGTPAAPPGTPVASKNGSGSVVVQWQAAADEGTAISSYTVTSSPGGLTASTSDGRTLQANVTGLTNGTAYTFTVKANNSNGASTASSASNSVTPSATAVVPVAPVVGVADAQAGGTQGLRGSVHYGSTGASDTTNKTGVITLDSATAIGDMILVRGFCRSSTGTMTLYNSNGSTVAPGFTAVPIVYGTGASTWSQQAWWKLADGTEDTGFVIGSSVSAMRIVGGCASYQGVDQVNQFDPNPPSVSGLANTSSTSIDAGTPTATTIDGDILVGAFADAFAAGGTAQSIIVPSGWTQRGSQTGTSDATHNNVSMVMADKIQTAHGAVGDVAATTSLATINGGMVFVLRAAKNKAIVSYSAPACNGGSAILSYTATSSPGALTGTVNIAGSGTIEVDGLTPGTAYTFTVKATNSAGLSPASAASNSVTPSTTVVAPGQPTAVALGQTAATPGAHTFSLSYTEPTSSGGAAVSSHRAYIYDSTNVNTPLEILTFTTTNPYTFSDNFMQSGHQYLVVLTAINSAGESLGSIPSSAITILNSASVPSAPGTPTASAGNARAVLQWAAASDNGAPIDYYQVTSSPATTTQQTADGQTLTLTFTGLTNGTAYTFTVKAHNSQGLSAASAASNSVTPTTTVQVPGAPTIGTVSVTGAGAVAVPFTAPASDGGAAIDKYVATSSPGSITGQLSQAGSGTIAVTGLLSDGTAYTFTVKAHNSAGFSSASAASNSVTPTGGGGGKPSAPSITSVTPGDSQLTVAFDAPSSGSPFDKYQVETDTGSVVAQGTASPITITGLTNGTPYKMRAEAHNTAGWGTWTAYTSSSYTPAPTSTPTRSLALLAQANESGQILIVPSDAPGRDFMVLASQQQLGDNNGLPTPGHPSPNTVAQRVAMFKAKATAGDSTTSPPTPGRSIDIGLYGKGTHIDPNSYQSVWNNDENFFMHYRLPANGTSYSASSSADVNSRVWSFAGALMCFVANTNFINFWKSFISTEIGLGWDFVFLDMLGENAFGNAATAPRRSGGVSVSHIYGPTSTTDTTVKDWLTDRAGWDQLCGDTGKILYQTAAAAGGYCVGNSLKMSDMTSFQRSGNHIYHDGGSTGPLYNTMAEDFFGASAGPPNVPGAAAALLKIQMIQYVAGLPGTTVFAGLSKYWFTSGTDAEWTALRRFIAAVCLLGQSGFGNVQLGFEKGNSADVTNYTDINCFLAGAPSGSANLPAAAGSAPHVWDRPYAHGLVVLNAESGSNSYTFPAGPGGTYFQDSDYVATGGTSGTRYAQGSTHSIPGGTALLLIGPI